MTSSTTNRHDEKLEPWAPDSVKQIEQLTSYPFPAFDGIPPGWEETEGFFVDSSGFGKPGEPALTIEQFQSMLLDHAARNPSDSYAVTGRGQFQLFVSALRRTQKA